MTMPLSIEFDVKNRKCILNFSNESGEIIHYYIFHLEQLDDIMNNFWIQDNEDRWVNLLSFRSLVVYKHIHLGWCIYGQTFESEYSEERILSGFKSKKRAENYLKNLLQPLI